MTAAAIGTEAAATTTRTGKPTGRDIRTALGFLAPSLIGVIAFLLVPVVVVIVLSFVKWDLLTPPSFVGVSNYIDIFRYDAVGHSLLVTAYYVLLNIPAQTVIALGLAVLLNRKLPGTSFVRVLCVLPYLATPVAMAVVWNWFFDPSTGVINTLLGFVGIAGPSWLSSQVWAMPVVAFANIWQYVGYNMLFFLAGLQSIPASMYEAAAIDGASRIKQFFSITLPLLRPTMLFVLVTGVIGSFQVFDTVYVLTNGGPGDATEVMNSLIYKSAFVGFRIGDAAAMSVVLFVVILVVTIVQFGYFRNRTTYEMN
ncbi:multiple sugar transport system permease protein/sn-glycerol 3-phosphate transport system permease protein [Friedmanniella endophytica]|uniref:Multiple sugar transport system permease protein/sn-glycerol 3-phosphate transport system permease protein n=1 Tax=Microlunatus kandeliicorticis TaxID=1759536 RepID=A0A7W3P4T1_9ACTN|nr:sugar ABC transporter permease [Microlunatus kandeliicorticis]MBA8793140.1 multiple sugar transport system permease protein/sn-glycerol 3-phosphate transport system permease protein [Microlunatus kandeliicorticis]